MKCAGGREGGRVPEGEGERGRAREREGGRGRERERGRDGASWREGLGREGRAFTVPPSLQLPAPRSSSLCRACVTPRRHCLAQCPFAPVGLGRAHGETVLHGALKTQELGRATVCTLARSYGSAHAHWCISPCLWARKYCKHYDG